MAAKKSRVPQDPTTNKNSAIRRVIKRDPSAKVGDVVTAVKDEFGHKVSPDRILMEKTKNNMVTAREQTKTNWKTGHPVGAAQWIEAIKIAQQLLSVTGSVDNAMALLNALDKSVE